MKHWVILGTVIICLIIGMGFLPVDRVTDECQLEGRIFNLQEEAQYRMGVIPNPCPPVTVRHGLWWPITYGTYE